MIFLFLSLSFHKKRADLESFFILCLLLLLIYFIFNDNYFPRCATFLPVFLLPYSTSNNNSLGFLLNVFTLAIVNAIPNTTIINPTTYSTFVG